MQGVDQSHDKIKAIQDCSHRILNNNDIFLAWHNIVGSLSKTSHILKHLILLSWKTMPSNGTMK